MNASASKAYTIRDFDSMSATMTTSLQLAPQYYTAARLKEALAPSQRLPHTRYVAIMETAASDSAVRTSLALLSEHFISRVPSLTIQSILAHNYMQQETGQYGPNVSGAHDQSFLGR